VDLWGEEKRGREEVKRGGGGIYTPRLVADFPD
jgi:hypothetical protein